MQSIRRKERVKEVQKFYRDEIARKKAFHDKDIPEEELAAIKKEIRAKAKKKATQHTIVLVVSVAFFVFGCIALLVYIL